MSCMEVHFPGVQLTAGGDDDQASCPCSDVTYSPHLRVLLAGWGWGHQAHLGGPTGAKAAASLTPSSSLYFSDPLSLCFICMSHAG